MRSRFPAEHEALAAYPQCLYWSSHTTAGFLDRSISARLNLQRVSTYVEAFRTVFPEGAGYEHDQLRSPRGSRRRAAGRRTEERRLAPGVHGQRPAPLRHASQPGGRGGLLRRSGRRGRRAAAQPGDAHVRLPRGAPGHPHPHRGAGLGASDRFGEPEGSAPGDLGRAVRVRRRGRASARAGSTSRWIPASAIRPSPSTSTRRC